MTETKLFDSYAENYDGYRRDMIPGFEDFYGIMLERAKNRELTAPDVIDLGAGTGLSTSLLQDAFSDASVTLLDSSEEMLNKARNRFENSNYEFLQEDLRDVELQKDQFDIVLSALVFHYIEDSDKKRLFRTVHRGLKPGGVFTFGTVLKASDSDVREEYRKNWLQYSRKNDVPEAVIEDALERVAKHKRATLNEHINWLKAAGFNCVDCWYKNYGLAVFSGKKSD
ncbi:MAG: trans-aconitate 2-methyltransferase [bacterium]